MSEDVHLERLSSWADSLAEVAAEAARDHVAGLHVTLHVVAAVRGEAAVAAAIASHREVPAATTATQRCVAASRQTEHITRSHFCIPSSPTTAKTAAHSLFLLIF